MEQPQRSLKIIDRRIARHDDRDPPSRRLLQRRQHQRPRLDRRAGDVDAPILDALADRLNAFVRASSARMRAVRVGEAGMGGGF